MLQFVPLAEVDPIYFAKSYYIEPEKTGTKPYVLLRNALEESGKVAIVKVALRNREALATLRVRDGVFVLETMLWPDEIRTPSFDFLDEKVEVRAQELAMAASLIETLTGDFDPSQYTDSYREALQAVIDAKIEGREVVQPENAQPTSGTVVDLMAALRASVDAAKKAQSGTTESAADKKPAKKTAGKKTAKAPAKKAAEEGTGAQVRVTSCSRRAATSSRRAAGRWTRLLVEGLDGPVVVTALAGEIGSDYRRATANGVRHFSELD